MADYASLKVPELKKLLAEKSLSQTGNKADLIARLVEDDKKNATEEDSKPAEPEKKPGKFPPQRNLSRGHTGLIKSRHKPRG